MYLDWNQRPTFVIDIEGDSLTPTVLWCMCWLNVQTGEKGDCIGLEEIKAFFQKAPKDAIFVGHNGLKFDFPVLKRMVGANISVSNSIDTLVLSTLYSPSLSGGHSLGSWGERLGFPKGDFHDFSRFSEEMLTYCRQDVLITAKLFVRLMKTLERIGFSEQSLWIQHRLTVILEQQRQNGFYFDGPRALQLYSHLRHRESELEDEIRKVFPSEEHWVATRKQYKKDGTFTAQYEKDLERYKIRLADEDGYYMAFEDVEFSVGSPKQRVDKLLSLGWKPEEFTDAGNPKPFDKGKLSPSLEAFLETNPVPEVELIARWMSINGRANMINTWLDNWNEDDGCIHGKLFVADTLRLRHQAPNTANIPAVRINKTGEVLLGEHGYYTYESRDLWTARKGRVLVGTDAAGLELRMLAHYLNRKEFTKQVVEGDPHQANADMIGVSRSAAKTILYSVQYGAGAPKVAKTLGVSVQEGAKLRKALLDKLGVGELMDECKREQSNGRLSLVDGSHIICPSPHAALNYKLQGGGARVMALALVLLSRWVRQKKLDVLFVGNIHDEWQADVHPNDADEYAYLSVKAIEEAGQLLKMNCPLTGEAKKGLTWSQTH